MGEICIDGIIFSLQQRGGISVYFHQLLHCLQLQRERATLTLEIPTRQQPTGLGTSTTVLGRAARFLERYRACRLPQAASVFHSSYYRLPSDPGVPTVVTVHDFIYERYSSGPRRWVHLRQKHAAIRAAQFLICISESTRQDLLHWVGLRSGQTVHVIHNGVADTFFPIETSPAPRPYVLFIGERGGYKNFRLALQAMAFLPGLELHCVGGGALRSAELAGVDAGIRNRVRHLGFVSDQALNELYNRALCLAYLSSYEGFGIPVVEAMRAGCPVVSMDCAAVKEVGAQALTIVAEPDPRRVADAIAHAATSTARSSLVSQGLAVASGYSWAHTHSQTLDVYRSLA